jgi:hypothetical protein
MDSTVYGPEAVASLAKNFADQGSSPPAFACAADLSRIGKI